MPPSFSVAAGGLAGGGGGTPGAAALARQGAWGQIGTSPSDVGGPVDPEAVSTLGDTWEAGAPARQIEVVWDSTLESTLDKMWQTTLGATLDDASHSYAGTTSTPRPHQGPTASQQSRSGPPSASFHDHSGAGFS